MNILDLKKGDKIFVGVKHCGNGFPKDAYMAEEVSVRDVMVRKTPMGNMEVRVRCQWSDYVQVFWSDGSIPVYASKENFFDGIAIEIPKLEKITGFISKELKLPVRNEYGLTHWIWDEEDKQPKERVLDLYTNGGISLFRLPKKWRGLYGSPEECRHDNKPVNVVKVTKEYLVRTDDDEYADWLLQHPDEYECNGDDECVSDASMVK